MKKLKLRNARLEELTKTEVSFSGELKGRAWKWVMNITDIQRYHDLQKLDRNTTYNIWHENGYFRFIPR